MNTQLLFAVVFFFSLSSHVYFIFITIQEKFEGYSELTVRIIQSLILGVCVFGLAMGIVSIVGIARVMQTYSQATGSILRKL